MKKIVEVRLIQTLYSNQMYQEAYNLFQTENIRDLI